MRAQPHQDIPKVDQLIGSLIYLLQGTFPKSEKLERARRLNVERTVKHLGEGRLLEIDRRRNLSRAEFIREYRNPGIPVILEGASADWPCVKKWSLDFLESGYGDTPLKVQYLPGLVEKEYISEDPETEKVSMITGREYVRAVRNGEKPSVLVSPLIADHPELLKDLDCDWLKYMRGTRLGGGYQTILNAAGRTTRFHTESMSSFFILAHGLKRWTMVSPKASVILNPQRVRRGYNFSGVEKDKPDPKHPGFLQLSRYQCIVKPGDVLFQPAWMWHEVDTLEDSWATAYRFTDLRGFMNCPTFAFARVFQAKPSLLESIFRTFVYTGKHYDENMAQPKVSLRN